MSNMNEGRHKDTRLTISEREQSTCARRAYMKNPKEYNPLKQSQFWQGMNERDETDECTRRPVGRGLSEGFLMMNPDYDGGDYDER